MKRILAVLLTVAMLFSIAVVASSCAGNKKVAAFQIPEGGYDGSEVTISFDHTMGANLRGVLDLYIAEFNKLYPNIHIESTQVGSYDDVRDQIKTEITAGNQPNIAYCYPDHVALYNVAGAVVTLDDLMASDITVNRADGTTEILGLTAEQKADFIEAYLDEGKQFGDGLTYTMPFSKSTEVLYYNKTFFDANNLKVPTTWEEMEATCEAIKKIDPKSIPLGYDSESNWFITMTEQLGTPYTSATGDHYIFNTPENRAFVEKFVTWYQKGYITTAELYAAYTSGLFTSTTEEKSYMCIGSSAGASYQRPGNDSNGNPLFDVGITSVPTWKGKDRKVISQGPSVCIFNKSNPQEVIASWLFVKFLTTSVDFQAEFSMVSGYVPVLKSVAEHPVYADFLSKANGGSQITALSAKVCLEQADYYYASPAFNGSSEARSQVGYLLTKCLAMTSTGEGLKKELEAAFKEAVNQCIIYGG